MYKVDMNSDLGESFGTYKLGMDAEILEFVSSAKNTGVGCHFLLQREERGRQIFLLAFILFF